MYCGKCGQKLTGEERFCPKCGNSVVEGGSDRVVSQCSKVKEGKETLLPEIINNNKSKLRKYKKKTYKLKKMLVVAAGLIVVAVMAVVVYQITQPGVTGGQYLAVVTNEEGKNGFINEKGVEVIPCEYDFATGYWKDGMTVIGEKVGEDEDGRNEYVWGLINTKGKTVVPPQYDDFVVSDNFIAVAKKSGKYEQGEPVLDWGFLDSNGEPLTDFKYQFDSRPNLSGNIAVVTEITGERNEEGDVIYNYGAINQAGEEIIPLQYQYIPDVSYPKNQGDIELIAVGKEVDGERKYGFISYNNEIVIPFKYDYAYNFSDNGLAVVRKNGKYGYIDKSGNVVLPFEYEYADPFSENGLAFVNRELGGECECINEKGETVIPNDRYKEYGNWYSASSFDDDGLADVFIEAEGGNILHGIIDEAGNLIITPEDKGITRFYTKYPFTIFWSLNEKEDEPDLIYKFADKDGEMLNNTYDYAGLFAENGWCCVGTTIGKKDDGSKRYQYSYVNENEETVLSLSKEYILAGEFRSVNQE